jgi:hypothetical protein
MSKNVNKSKVSIEKLSEELQKINYEYVWEYIESVDKCTYFKTQWGEYVISVCFFISGDSIGINHVICDDISDFVMGTVEEEIKGAIERSIIINKKKEVA